MRIPIEVKGEKVRKVKRWLRLHLLNGDVKMNLYEYGLLRIVLYVFMDNQSSLKAATTIWRHQQNLFYHQYCWCRAILQKSWFILENIDVQLSETCFGPIQKIRKSKIYISFFKKDFILTFNLMRRPKRTICVPTLFLDHLSPTNDVYVGLTHKRLQHPCSWNKVIRGLYEDHVICPL